MGGVVGLAETLAECGGLAARLVELHNDDGTGHCEGCRWWDRPLPVHPCATRVAADRALEIRGEDRR
jgi:hypothetical protein